VRLISHDFVKERKQFGWPIAEFEGLQWLLADMAVALNTARLSLRQAALSADPFPNSLLAAQAKIIASETANTVTNQALQLFDGRSYELSPRTYGSKCPHVHHAGGTAQVLRTLVASGMLGTKIPQTRNGHLEAVQAIPRRKVNRCCGSDRLTMHGCGIRKAGIERRRDAPNQEFCAVADGRPVIDHRHGAVDDAALDPSPVEDRGSQLAGRATGISGADRRQDRT
jgi:hypothetical protein